MAGFQWAIMLLVVHLVGLIDNKPISAAPVDNSQESQQNDMMDNEHEIDKYNGGKDDGEGGEDGDAYVSSKEDQEVGNEKGHEISNNEYSEVLSVPYKDEDTKKSQDTGTSIEEVVEEESNKSSDDKPTEEKSKNVQVPDIGVDRPDVDERNYEDKSEEENYAHYGDSSLETDDHDNDDDNAPLLPDNSRENGHDAILESGGAHSGSIQLSPVLLSDSGKADDIEIHKSSEFTEAPDSEFLTGTYNRQLPLSENQIASAKKDDVSDGDSVPEDIDHNESDSLKSSNKEESVTLHVNHEEEVLSSHEGLPATHEHHEEDLHVNHEEEAFSSYEEEVSSSYEELPTTHEHHKHDLHVIHEEKASSSHEELPATHEHHKEDSATAHELDTNVSHGTDKDTFASHDSEEDTHAMHDHKEDADAAHAEHAKEKDSEANKEESAEKNETVYKDLSLHVSHEKATATLVYGAILQDVNQTKSYEHIKDHNVEVRDEVEISSTLSPGVEAGRTDLPESDDVSDNYDDNNKEGDDGVYPAKADNSEATGVAEHSSDVMSTRKEDDDGGGGDGSVIEENDSDTDTLDKVVLWNEDSSERESNGSGDRNLNVEGSGGLEESAPKSDTEIKILHVRPRAKSFGQLSAVPTSDSVATYEGTTTNCNCSENVTGIPGTTEMSNGHDDVEDKGKTDVTTAGRSEAHDKKEESNLEKIDENTVMKSVPDSKNNTLVSRPSLQKSEIREQDSYVSINENGLGSQSKDSEQSQSSVGSYIVLGIIMGIIVILLGYSVIKSRHRNTQEAKNEDNETEMADVNKPFLPGNEFNGSIYPKAHPETDESNAKLLEDKQYKEGNAENEETHKMEGGICGNGVQNQNPKAYPEADEHSAKLLADTQYKEGNAENEDTHKVEAGACEKDVQNQCPEVHPKADESNAKLLEDMQYKEGNAENEGTHKVEAGVCENDVQNQKELGESHESRTKQGIDLNMIESQLEPLNVPTNPFKSQSQDSSNPLPEAVIPNEQATAVAQNAQDQSVKNPFCQNLNNNVNDACEVVIESPPSVPGQSYYVQGQSYYVPGQSYFVPGNNYYVSGIPPCTQRTRVYQWKQ
jgi:hypothetical protein